MVVKGSFSSTGTVTRHVLHCNSSKRQQNSTPPVSVVRQRHTVQQVDRS